MHGWLNVDKPEGWSSAQLVTKVKRLLSAKKVGHAGTLDPMATGVLPIAIGHATKTIRFIQDLSKEYLFSIKFGAATDSFDKTGQIVVTTDKIPTKDELEKVKKYFLGDIEQVPPIYSAIKVDGKRAYLKARSGENFKMERRPIRIESLELRSYQDGKAIFYVKCSKGTYVRSLAHDIAIKLSSFGHVDFLRRVSVGDFCENNLISLENFKTMVYSDTVRLLSIESMLKKKEFIDVSTDEAKLISNGVSVKISHEIVRYIKGEDVFAKHNKVFVAFGKLNEGVFIPKKCFNFN